MIAQPGEGSFDDPAVPVTTQWSSVLSLVLGKTVAPVRRDHLDAQLREGFIEFIAVVSLVSDQSTGLGLGGEEIERGLNHLRFSNAGGIDGEPQRNALGINNYLKLCAFAIAGQAHSQATAFGRAEGRIDEALLEIDPAVLNQLPDDLRQQPTERRLFTPQAQIIMDGAFRRKALGEVFPLNAGMQNKQNCLEDLPRLCSGPTKLTLTRNT